MRDDFPETDRPYDVITFGDLCVDLVVTGADVAPRFGQVEKLVDDYLLEMGGSCSIFACQAARLGLRAAVLGRVGDDDFGRLVLRRMDEYGVDTRHVMVDPALKTGIGIALCQGNDRAILTYPGSLSSVEPGDVRDEFLAAARHLHHGSHFLHSRLRPHMAEIFRRARRLGLSISLDTNWDPGEQWELGGLLPLVDVFLPNEQEALAISRRPDLESAAAFYAAQGIRCLVVKRGAQGAVVYAGGRKLEARPAPAGPGGDSIGAGDSFDAGFLAGWLRRLPLEDCLSIAGQCGRAVASARGGIAGQPAWQALEGPFSLS